eukprot:scaffold928_cov189-Chaetoceros_neogracile.AAC.2
MERDGAIGIEKDMMMTKVATRLPPGAFLSSLRKILPPNLLTSAALSPADDCNESHFKRSAVSLLLIVVED